MTRKSTRRYDAGAALTFIIQHKQSHDGNAPTLKQIGQFMGINSGSTVRNLLGDLVKQNKIVLGVKGDARQIMVVGGCWVHEPTFIKYLQTLDMGNGYAELIIGSWVSYQADRKL